MWLELLFSELFRYPDVNQSIGIINKEDKETCLHEFISNYLPDPYVRTTSGYAINATFRNNDENDLDKLQQLNNFAIERCDMLSRPCKKDSRDIIFEVLDKDNVNNANNVNAQDSPKAKADEQASDQSDKVDEGEDKDEEKKEADPNGSRPDQPEPESEPKPESEPPPYSRSIYEHLIVTEDMPATGRTAYQCKEHSDKWDTDLKGLEISHFEPYHNNTDTGTATGNVQ